MYVEYDTDIPPPRCHPWTSAAEDLAARYRDFKVQPEQIPFVLEDFAPWAHYAAIPRFYQLLTWLNGSDSLFESNDCGLRPPRTDNEAPEVISAAFASAPIVVHGRLTFVFRNLNLNTLAPTVDGLKKVIHDALRDQVPNIPAVVKIGDWAHLFTAIDKEGRAVTLRLWAWGDDEEMAMRCLYATFDAIHGCLQWISGAMQSQSGQR